MLLKGRDGSNVLKTKLGTPGYMAPEIAKREYDGRKVDIFAAGVILFIMYVGAPPFESTELNDPYFKCLTSKRYEVFWKAHSRKRPKNFFSNEFKDLFVSMIAADPAERIPIEKIANHPWCKQDICTYK